VLRWVEDQPDPIVFLILVGLYTWVSLPVAWGYIIINIATGYLYGLGVGLLVTFASATLGIILAHYLIKTFLVKYVER
jgi:protein maelstrom